MSVLVGRVGLVLKGAWDSSVAYAAMDVVTYGNSTYTAKQAVPAGTLPTNTTYWELSLDASLLQPKTMSSPVAIGGESKTTVEAAVGALEDVKADKTAISSVETTSTAVSAHAVGSYFTNASGQFVQATSAIEIGDTISGSNTAVSSVEESKASKSTIALVESTNTAVYLHNSNRAFYNANGDLVKATASIPVGGTISSSNTEKITMEEYKLAGCSEDSDTVFNFFNDTVLIRIELGDNTLRLYIKNPDNPTSWKMKAKFNLTRAT